ncbi:MAG: hypothetical protein ABI534_00735 [Chloroflexota bacterium]
MTMEQLISLGLMALALILMGVVLGASIMWRRQGGMSGRECAASTGRHAQSAIAVHREAPPALPKVVRTGRWR